MAKRGSRRKQGRQKGENRRERGESWKGRRRLEEKGGPEKGSEPQRNLTKVPYVNLEGEGGGGVLSVAERRHIQKTSPLSLEGAVQLLLDFGFCPLPPLPHFPPLRTPPHPPSRGPNHSSFLGGQEKSASHPPTKFSKFGFWFVMTERY